MKNVNTNGQMKQDNIYTQSSNHQQKNEQYHIGDLNINSKNKDYINIGAVLGNVNIIQQSEGVRFENNSNNRVINEY